MKTLHLKIVFTLLLCIGFTSLQAQDTPRDLSSLVDMRASSLDYQMNEKGYTHIKTDKSTAGSYGYWWSNSKKKCVVTRVSDGRVKSVVSSLPADCGKSASSGGRSYNYNDYGYNSNYRNDDEKQSYRRGYHDGKRNLRRNENYSSEIQINAYNKGYNDGKADKRMDSYYAGGYENVYHNDNHNYHNYNNHHYSSNQNNSSKWYNFSSLKGMKAKAAYANLEQHGFANTKTFQEDGVTYKLWWDSKREQCIKTYSKDYYLARIENSHNCE